MSEGVTGNFDIGEVGKYLEANIEEFSNLLTADKFNDGQSNPTFLLNSESGQYVLRRQPPGDLLKSAHAVDREYRVMSALFGHGVPVPEPLHLCLDRSILGCLFYVMRYVPGVIYWNAALPELSRDQRYRVFDDMNLVLANLHDVDVELVGLSDFGMPGNYFERQVSRWSQQYRASEIEPIGAMNVLLEWLPKNTPPDDGLVSVIHGDYRLDNMIFAQNSNTIVAVLDWELSTLGHPFADLAYQCMQWRLPQDAPIPGLAGINRKASGIPTESEYIARYCERRGLREIDNWHYYLVFSFFRFAAILQGVLKRAVDGNASSHRAFEFGQLAPILARMAVDILNRAECSDRGAL